MKQYFLNINTYCTKNKAHEVVQEYARLYTKCLFDEPQFFQFAQNMKEKIAEVNNQFKRCSDIHLEFRRLNDNTYIFSVDGNFSFSVYEVKRYELAPAPRDMNCNTRKNEHNRRNKE